LKIHVLSDVHIEFGKFRHEPPECDVVVLAGDIGPGKSGIAWAQMIFKDVPVIYVPGNHEFWGRIYSDHVLAMAKRSADAGILFGHNSTFVINGVRFICATLWTDLEIWGDTFTAGLAARRGMRDFDKIQMFDDRHQGGMGVQDWLDIHHESRAFIEGELARDFDGKTVVVTHHAPSEQSTDRVHYAGNPLTPCYASNLEKLILERQPALWIHGHVHQTFDYCIDRTRVVANPRGYVGMGPEHLNITFNPSLLVEI
jgi:predicted phosphodiesterase